MMAVSTICRIYSYVSEDNYSALENLRNKLVHDGYKISFSKIVRIAVMELLNKEYNDIKELLNGDTNNERQ